MEKKMPYTQSEVLQAYQTPILDIARRYFEIKPERNVFKVLNNGGLYIFENGCNWYCHSTGEKGSNVDFLIKYCGIGSKREAIDILLKEAHITPAAQLYSEISHSSKQPKDEMKLPLKNKETYKHMFAYLIRRRCIDPDIVKTMVAEKKIYEDFHHNAVFVAYNKNNIPKYAAVRGTSQVKYCGEVLNSDKDYPWTMSGTSDRVFVFESPIDAMSHATLTLLNSEDWRKDWRISLGGTADRALKTFIFQHPEIKTIVFCLDNDYKHIDPRTGELLNVGQEAVSKHARTYIKLGYKVQKLVPTMPYKDFNEHLTAYCQSLQQQPDQDLTKAAVSEAAPDFEQAAAPEI